MSDALAQPKPLALPGPLLIIAGWVLPGLAHYLIGQRTRGVIVGATVLALFIGGVLIGGIDVVDYRRDRLWFAGQVLAGPIALGVDQTHKLLEPPTGTDSDDRTIYYSPDADAEFGSRDRRYDTSIGRMNELGTLYCALAGVLNLLIILDAVGRGDENEPLESDTKGGA